MIRRNCCLWLLAASLLLPAIGFAGDGRARIATPYCGTTVAGLSWMPATCAPVVPTPLIIESQPVAPRRQALLEVFCPGDAVITVNNYQTTAKGTRRFYELTAWGHGTTTYVVEAKAKRNGGFPKLSAPGDPRYQPGTEKLTISLSPFDPSPVLPVIFAEIAHIDADEVIPPAPSSPPLPMATAGEPPASPPLPAPKQAEREPGFYFGTSEFGKSQAGEDEDDVPLFGSITYVPGKASVFAFEPQRMPDSIYIQDRTGSPAGFARPDATIEWSLTVLTDSETTYQLKPLAPPAVRTGVKFIGKNSTVTFDTTAQKPIVDWIQDSKNGVSKSYGAKHFRVDATIMFPPDTTKHEFKNGLLIDLVEP